MAPTILITRPDPVGARFAAQVRRRFGDDVAVVLSPLLGIRYCSSLPDMSRVTTLIFTSGNGAEAYGRLAGQRDIPAYAVGDATAAVAREQGLRVIACDGDAPSLVRRMIEDRVRGPCLHLRGEHVAGQIANDLNSAGIETHEAVIYRQPSMPLNDLARSALDQRAPVIVPLFSPRSARLLFENDLGKAALFVAAMSANVAAEVPRDLRAELAIAHTPTAEAMLTAMQGLMDAAKRLEGGNPSK